MFAASNYLCKDSIFRTFFYVFLRSRHGYLLIVRLLPNCFQSPQTFLAPIKCCGGIYLRIHHKSRPGSCTAHPLQLLATTMLWFCTEITFCIFGLHLSLVKQKFNGQNESDAGEVQCTTGVSLGWSDVKWVWQCWRVAVVNGDIWAFYGGGVIRIYLTPQYTVFH